MVNAKVLTLNAWGIVGISKHRRERFDALAYQLATEEPDFDFVFLQEVWSENDFVRLVQATGHVLPYSHYFHSGVFGSGVCLLSRWPIIDTFAYKYNLNGYAHKFYHGDWFGGKVVGMAKVQHLNMIANLYVTHLHAEYNRLQDTYLYHRVSQAFEFSQFVSHTSLGSCDYAIVAGDFNTQPNDLPYQIILYNSRLCDTFYEKGNCSVTNNVIATCGHPANSYTRKADLKEHPRGVRIDYILFSCGTNRVNVTCEKYTCPSWKTPTGLNISDHEPVVAVLRILKNDSSALGSALDCDVNNSDPMAFVNFLNDGQLACRIECLEKGAALMESTLSTFQTNRVFFFGFASLLLLLLLVSIPIDFYVEGLFVILLHIARIVMSLLLGFCVLMGFFWHSMERRSVLSTQQAMSMLLRFLRVQYAKSVTSVEKDVRSDHSSLIQCSS